MVLVVFLQPAIFSSSRVTHAMLCNYDLAVTSNENHHCTALARSSVLSGHWSAQDPDIHLLVD